MILVYRRIVMDIIFLALGALCFVLMLGLARACAMLDRRRV